MEKYLEEWNRFEQNMNFYISKVLNEPLIPPDSVYFHVTSRCNIRCKICNIPLDAKESLELKKEEIFNIIDQISEWGVYGIVLTGGEALIRKDIFDIIKYAASKNLRVHLLTNGTLINKKVLKKLVEAGVWHIHFSIHGFENVHDYISGGKGNFSRSVKIMSFIKNDGKNIKYPKVGISIPVTCLNFKQLPRLIKYFGKLINAELILVPLVDNISVMSERTYANIFFIKKNQFKIFDKVFDKIIKERKLSKYPSNSIRELKIMKNYYKMQDVREKITCYEGFYRITISPEGQIATCYKKIGNCKTEPIKKIWISKEFQKLRERMNCSLPCIHASTIGLNDITPKDIHEKYNFLLNNKKYRKKFLKFIQKHKILLENKKETINFLSKYNNESDSQIIQIKDCLKSLENLSIAYNINLNN